MAHDRLEDHLKRILVEGLMLKLKAEDISDEDDLIEKCSLDSPQLMQMVVSLEEVFGIELGDEEFSLAKFRTITCIANVVRRKKPGA